MIDYVLPYSQHLPFSFLGEFLPVVSFLCRFPFSVIDFGVR